MGGGERPEGWGGEEVVGEPGRRWGGWVSRGGREGEVAGVGGTRWLLGGQNISL